MLTKKQILDQLKKENVDLGSNPERTFIYYQQIGLLPHKKGSLPGNKRIGLFPDWIPGFIKRIKKAQQEGIKLWEIKKAFDKVGELLEIEWSRVLNLDNPEAIKKIHHHVLSKGKEMYHLVTVFYPDRIHWFKVKISGIAFEIPEDFKILDSKTFRLEEYSEFVKKLAVKIAKEQHRILEHRDIDRAIFA